MRQQPSKRAIALRLEWLNKALGHATKPYVHSAPTNAFYVDHGFGGYRIECQGHAPFGHQRMTKTQLCDQLEAILVAIKLARGEQTGSNWPTKAPDGSDIRPTDKAA